MCVVQVRSLKLEQEVEKNNILSEALHTLATEQHELERSVVKGSSPQSALSDDEFYDAVSGEYGLFLFPIGIQVRELISPD